MLPKNIAIRVQARKTLCRYQARVNGKASQKRQPNISLKNRFNLLLFSSSYFYLKLFIVIHVGYLENKVDELMKHV